MEQLQGPLCAVRDRSERYRRLKADPRSGLAQPVTCLQQRPFMYVINNLHALGATIWFHRAQGLLVSQIPLFVHSCAWP